MIIILSATFLVCFFLVGGGQAPPQCLPPPIRCYPHLGGEDMQAVLLTVRTISHLAWLWLLWLWLPPVAFCVIRKEQRGCSLCLLHEANHTQKPPRNCSNQTNTRLKCAQKMLYSFRSTEFAEMQI